MSFVTLNLVNPEVVFVRDGKSRLDISVLDAKAIAHLVEYLPSFHETIKLDLLYYVNWT